MPRILIAEDEHRIASFLEKGLRAHGFTTVVMADIRQRGDRLPVIALTARESVRDRVAGLEQGADDYVTKPFSFEELLARIRVQLRHSTTEDTTVLRCGDLMLDLRTGGRLSVSARSNSPRASTACSKCSSGTPTRSCLANNSSVTCGL